MASSVRPAYPHPASTLVRHDISLQKQNMLNKGNWSVSTSTWRQTPAVFSLF